MASHYMTTVPSMELYHVIDAAPRLRLRFDYTNLDRLSPLAKQTEAVQNNCTIKKRGIYYHVNGSGLGSELHIYSIVMCSVLGMGDAKFRTFGSWIYNDVKKCHHQLQIPHAPMSCYFPQAEPDCPTPPATSTTTETTTAVEQFDVWYQVESASCSRFTDLAGGRSYVRAAITEYLFTRVSDIVQNEGERQLNLVFGGGSTKHRITTGQTIVKQRNVPNNLITVHIRWGDKGDEMKLIPIQNYTAAVQQILDERVKKNMTRYNKNINPSTSTATNDDSDNDDSCTGVHILLATEDPEAVKQFMSIKPKHWNVYVDQYYYEMLPYRIKVGNVFNVNALYSENKDIQGRNGLIALGSLLVAMEATDYVLTTASNWSRLMNEIRKNIIDPRCNHCTIMIDLLYDEL